MVFIESTNYPSLRPTPHDNNNLAANAIKHIVRDPRCMLLRNAFGESITHSVGDGGWKTDLNFTTTVTVRLTTLRVLTTACSLNS